jgi:hypothetical protein
VPYYLQLVDPAVRRPLDGHVLGHVLDHQGGGTGELA